MEANSTIGPGIIWHQDPATVSILVLTVIAFLVPMIYVYPPFPPRESDALFETHYKVGLHPSPAKPGLAGAQQQDPQQQQQQQQARPGVPGRIQSLWIYPLKSCRGIELDKSRVVPAGLEFDRLYTLAQLHSPFPVALDAPEADRAAHSWHFVTQRQFPRLATVEVELWRPDLVKCQRRGFASGDAFLIVRFPWREAGWRGALAWVAAKALRGRDGRPEREVMLPVDFPSGAEIEAKGYKYEQVKIWNDTVTALNMESELPEELQLYLGVSNKLGLFRIDPSHLREVYRGAPDRETAGYQPVTGFQDAFPLHLLSLSSVQDLEDKLEKDENLSRLDARRFRANIINTVNGTPAYEEEKWKAIRFLPEPDTPLDPVDFHVSCRTVRCKLPNVDQDLGVRHAVEPDKSLRRHRNVDEGAPLSGCLGMQMTPTFKKAGGRVLEMESTVAIGMSVKVLETGPHRYVKQ
ncbi:hypothetical protein RB600_003167 [Gaeumannomyces tritici]